MSVMTYLAPGKSCVHVPVSFIHPQYGSLEAMQALNKGDTKESSSNSLIISSAFGVFEKGGEQWKKGCQWIPTFCTCHDAHIFLGEPLLNNWRMLHKGHCFAYPTAFPQFSCLLPRHSYTWFEKRNVTIHSWKIWIKQLFLSQNKVRKAETQLWKRTNNSYDIKTSYAARQITCLAGAWQNLWRKCSSEHWSLFCFLLSAISNEKRLYI